MIILSLIESKVELKIAEGGPGSRGQFKRVLDPSKYAGPGIPEVEDA